MIHIRTQKAARDFDRWGDLIFAEDPVLHLSLVGSEDIQKLREILGRALNCVPEFGAAWFDLADKLDQFLAVPDLPIPAGPF